MALTGLNAYKRLFNNVSTDVQMNSFDEICILASCRSDAPVGFEHNLYLRQKKNERNWHKRLISIKKRRAAYYDIAIENTIDSDVITNTYTPHAAY